MRGRRRVTPGSAMACAIVIHSVLRRDIPTQLRRGDISPPAVSLRLDLSGSYALVECRATQAQHLSSFTNVEAKRLHFRRRPMHRHLRRSMSPSISECIRPLADSAQLSKRRSQSCTTGCDRLRSIPPQSEMACWRLRNPAQSRVRAARRTGAKKVVFG